MADAERLQQKFAALKAEQKDFVEQWREIVHWQAPDRGRFLDTKRNLGKKKNSHILNNRARFALRDAVSGIYAGTASPSTKWFTLTAPLELMRLGPVREWVHVSEEIVRAILRESKFYGEYTVAVTELLLFGTSAISQVDDFDTVTRFYTHTIGTYYIAKNHKNQVDTFALTRQMTARDIRDEFGEEKVPSYMAGDLKQPFATNTYQVVQLIEPNPDYDQNKLEPRFKRFLSTWFLNGGESQTHILRESGFDRFPTKVVRWTLGEDYAWGVDCPGMSAQPDVRSLQQRMKDMARAIDRHVKPKLKGPTSLLGTRLNDKQGDVIVYDQDNSREGLSPIYQIDPRINEMRQDVEHMEQAINEAYFVNLFRAISSMQGVQPRNQWELSQRNAEALLLLGPVLERVQQDLLAKVLEDTFAMALEKGLLPEMPPEMQDSGLEIKFISSLAQAQRSQDLAALGDFTQFAGAVAQALPYVADKVDGDAIIDLYTNLRGVNPMVNRDQEEVGQIRDQRQQAAQQQAQLQAEQQMASANVQNASAEKTRSEINA